MTKSRIQVANGNDELTFDEGFVAIGARNVADVVVDDALLADRHCTVSFENGFVLRDAGSVTGTWIDGERVTGARPLRDGQTIVVGTSRIQVAIDEDDGVATLSLTVDARSFWWKRAGKGAFDNDPDRMVRREVEFGRFPALRLGNRVAVIAGAVVLVAATFVSSVMARLADPGPLVPTHALLASHDGDGAHAGLQRCVELAGEQGCNVCHTTGRGAPEPKCMQCHGLPGQLGGDGTRRHPYHNDGALGAVPGMVVDDQFCVSCHTDHNGGDWLKAGARERVGQCAQCHAEADGSFDRTALIARATIELPPDEPRPFAGYRFPHDLHLAKQVSCETCHQLDAQLVDDRNRGVPDDPTRADFAHVPYEICAACHVPGSEARGIDAAEQARWREQSPQWALTWHGSDDDGAHCLTCHDRVARDGGTYFGPELRLVERPSADPERYRAERARYTTASRSHDAQFAKHAGDRACTECHLSGGVETPAEAASRPRTFWHALHLRPASLQPGTAAGATAGAISVDGTEGCASCHGDLGKDGADALTPANRGTYHWPQDDAAQAACRTCHSEGDGRALTLTAIPSTVDQRRRRVPDFPHDAHVGSASFGREGVLADGCFACHGFSEAAAEAPFSQVPTTKPEAASCRACHESHQHIAGNLCLQCHPADRERSNSFLESQRVMPGVMVYGRFVPAPATRPWPAPNGFSHLSVGHRDGKCTDCHGQSGLDAAGSLLDVKVPDERAALCRDCHLEKQFHWR